MTYIVAQEPMRFWMAIVDAHKVLVVAGTLLVVKRLLILKPAEVTSSIRPCP